MNWEKLTCTWCDADAITTVVQMKACMFHHDEYHRRRRAGESWGLIERDFFMTDNKQATLLSRMIRDGEVTEEATWMNGKIVEVSLVKRTP